MFLGAMKKKENWEVIISCDSDDELWLFSFLLVEKSLFSSANIFFYCLSEIVCAYFSLCGR